MSLKKYLFKRVDSINFSFLKVCGFICHKKKCTENESIKCKLNARYPDTSRDHSLRMPRDYTPIDNLNTINEDIKSAKLVFSLEEINETKRDLFEAEPAPKRLDVKKDIFENNNKIITYKTGRQMSWVNNPEDAYTIYKAEQEKYRINKGKAVIKEFKYGCCQRVEQFCIDKTKQFIKCCQSLFRKVSSLCW